MFKSINVSKHTLDRSFLALFFSVVSCFSGAAVAQNTDFGFVEEIDNTGYIGKYRSYSGSLRPSSSYNRNNNGFGRMFRPIYDRALSMHKLRRLSAGMREGYSGRRNLSETPAGYTFFGQFIDHDITLDTRSMLNGVIADGNLKNVRTPALDLDSVYGGGPQETPFLYNLPYLRVGKLIMGREAGARYDLLRTQSSRKHGPLGGASRALIGDPRNDENFIIAQIHTAFISFHNHLADILVERHYRHLRKRYCRRYRECSTRYLAGKLSKRDQIRVFTKAREHVIHYYHRIIAEDFLPRIIGEHRAYEILVNRRRFFFPDGFRMRNNSLENIYIPLEFSTAAFRFGHSQV
ncbi:MAG: peroxidase family protein, partial [Methyloligellaceae bacterium]